MLNPIASKQQMLRLLDKLSSDDLFRARFERNPKAALVEAGFAADDVATFPAEQLLPGTLASKDVFESERIRVQTDIAEECSCMILPSPLIAQRGKGFLAQYPACKRAA